MSSEDEDRRARYKRNYQHFATLPHVPHTPLDGTGCAKPGCNTAATLQSPSAVCLPPASLSLLYYLSFTQGYTARLPLMRSAL
jgi:hypothetical protein